MKGMWAIPSRRILLWASPPQTTEVGWEGCTERGTSEATPTNFPVFHLPVLNPTVNLHLTLSLYVSGRDLAVSVSSGRLM